MGLGGAEWDRGRERAANRKQTQRARRYCTQECWVAQEAVLLKAAGEVLNIASLAWAAPSPVRLVYFSAHTRVGNGHHLLEAGVVPQKLAMPCPLLWLHLCAWREMQCGLLLGQQVRYMQMLMQGVQGKHCAMPGVVWQFPGSKRCRRTWFILQCAHKIHHVRLVKQ